MCIRQISLEQNYSITWYNHHSLIHCLRTKFEMSAYPLLKPVRDISTSPQKFPERSFCIHACSVSWLALLSKLTSQSVMINLAFQRKSACCYLADKCLFEPPLRRVLLNQMFNSAWVWFSDHSAVHKQDEHLHTRGLMTSKLDEVTTFPVPHPKTEKTTKPKDFHPLENLPRCAPELHHLRVPLVPRWN